MMFVLVLCIGLAIGCGAHGYSIIDGLYWTIGCMTTAGGELEADSEMLQVLYILYMPTAAVAMLSIARTVVQATQRRAIRRDNYQLKVYSFLQEEARAKNDAAATMREADFIIAVLRANELIDLETVDAIKAQFGLITRRVRDSHGVISPEVVYKHLVQQGRVLPREAHQEEAISLEEAISQGTIRPDADDRFATVYVNMRVKDEGFAEWHEHYWLPSVVNSPDGDLPPPHAHNDVVAGEDSTPPANEGRSGWAGNGPYQRLLDA